MNIWDEKGICAFLNAQVVIDKTCTAFQPHCT